jgi:hypothetical protein
MLRCPFALAGITMALATNVPAQTPPSGRDRLSFRAADGTSSEVRQTGPTEPDGHLAVTPVRGGLDVTWMANIAGGCMMPQSVRHHVRADTVADTPDSVVVVVGYQGGTRLCPAVYTPAPFLLSVRGLSRGWYTLGLETSQNGPSHLWLTYVLAVP